jgi:protein-tyrosine phosphatase
MKILMVCLGNICRSPLAEGILKQKLVQKGLHWTVESAGTNGIHEGEAPHHLSQKVARLNGVDISTQRARKFRKEDLEAYDRIYAMAQDVLEEIKIIAKNKHLPASVSLFLNTVTSNGIPDVPDPWYGEEEGYHEVFQIIEKGCDAIIRQLEPQSNQ